MNAQTPADELRTAATAIRCKANAATPGPWAARVDYPHLVLQGDDDVISTNLAGSPAEDAEHIASWHPAVALAVADWLDSVAYALAAGDPDDLIGFGEPSAAFAVARAYLGTTQQETL